MVVKMDELRKEQISCGEGIIIQLFGKIPSLLFIFLNNAMNYSSVFLFFAKFFKTSFGMSDLECS